jgi:predicted RNA polymerase sigma factor
VSVSTTGVEAVFRMEFPRVVATLTAFVGDIGLAEDLAQDALVDALRQWPATAPRRTRVPGSRRLASEGPSTGFRRDRTLREKYARLGHELEAVVSLPPTRRSSSIRNQTRTLLTTAFA